MYIQLKNDPSAPVKMSKKLFNAIGFEKGKNPWFIQIVKDKNSNDFYIIKRKNVDTFVTQCIMVTPTQDRKCPGQFMWTIPSFEYFSTIINLNMITGGILRAKEVELPKIGKVWKISGK